MHVLSVMIHFFFAYFLLISHKQTTCSRTEAVERMRRIIQGFGGGGRRGASKELVPDSMLLQQRFAGIAQPTKKASASTAKSVKSHLKKEFPNARGKKLQLLKFLYT